MVVLSPSWPALLSPHAHRLPSERIATVCAKPAAIAFQVVGPPIRIGVVRLASELFPTCPLLLLPHAQSDPSFFNATVCEPPTATVFQLVAVVIRTGAARAVSVPSPSWPNELS